MADTLLRVGLWLVAAVLALYILAESNHDEPWAEMISRSALQQGLILAGVLVVAGIVARILGRGAKVVSKQRCKICKAPVASGAIYCREHLRSILHEEDEKLHTTRPGR